MAKTETDAPAEVQVEAAAEETAPTADTSGKSRAVSTTVWSPGRQAAREDLFRQAIVNVRDAVPVASYDVACEVKGTTHTQVNKTAGTAWEIEVTFTPRVDKPEPVDLERVIKEAQAGYGETHPGDPDFLGKQD